MGIQPSASVTGLLLACQRPFDPELQLEASEPGEPARYGSAFHFVLAEMLRAKKAMSAGTYAKWIDFAATRWDVKPAAHELAGHVKSSEKVLRNWLAREKLKIVEVERSYAFNPKNMRTRNATPPDEEHRYDLKPGKIGLTLDLWARSDAHEVVIDHKTGHHDGDWYTDEEDVTFALPRKLPQMRTLGTAIGVERWKRPLQIGVFHADRRGLPMMYSEELPQEEMTAHGKALAGALDRVGDGSLRPGAQCKRCPAALTCPAHAADLLGDGTRALVEAATTLGDEPLDPRGMLVPRGNTSLEARAAALYKLLKRFDKLSEAGREEIKRAVRAGAVIEVDGKVLELREESYETLSKASIMRTLGPLPGAKLIAKLRKQGVVEQKTREKLALGKD